MSDSKKKEEQELKFNPIDKDKIAENPHLLPYAHTVGGSVIKPIDKGRVKGLAVSAMYDQTEMQLDQIREQVTLLAAQAEKIHERVRISVGPNEWGKSMPFESFVATVTLLSDHTWDIL